MSETLDLVPIRARVFYPRTLYTSVIHLTRTLKRLVNNYRSPIAERQEVTQANHTSCLSWDKPITSRSKHMYLSSASAGKCMWPFFLLIGQVFDTSEVKLATHIFPRFTTAAWRWFASWCDWFNSISLKGVRFNSQSQTCNDGLKPVLVLIMSSYSQQLHYWNGHVCYPQLRSQSCRWCRWSAVAVRFQKLPRKAPYNVVVKYDLNRAYRSYSEFLFQIR